MRDGLIGAIVGIVVALAIGYMIWARPLTEAVNRVSAADTRAQQAEASGRSALAAFAARKPREAHITLKRKGTTADCEATIDNDHMAGYPEEDIDWYILNGGDEKCMETGAWAVHLEFTESDFPFDERAFRIGQTHRKLKVKKLATQNKTFTYKVVMVEQSGNKYTLIDPDLEVEPPIRILTAAAPAGAPPAVTNPPAVTTTPAPAKKQ